MEQNNPIEQAIADNEPDVPVSKLYKTALESGVLLALIGIGLFVLLYLIGVEFITKWWVGILILLVMLVIDVFLALRIKKKSGMKVISYWQAFFAVVIMMAVGAYVSSGFQYLMTKVIDPEYNENLKNATIKNTIEFMENVGAPQDQIDETIDGMLVSFESQQNFSVTQFLLGIVYSFIWFAVFAFIMAIWVRKKVPIFDPNLNRQT